MGVEPLGVQLLRAGVLRVAAGFWLAALALAAAFLVVTAPAFFVTSGVALGAGFIAAGLHLRRI